MQCHLARCSRKCSIWEPVGTGAVAVLLCPRLNYCHLGLARKGTCQPPGTKPVFFEGCHIVCDENKRNGV